MVDIGIGYRVHGEVSIDQRSGNVLILKQGPGRLQVQPEVVHIREGGHVRWWVWDDVVPEGGRIEIEFDLQGGNKGPFRQWLGDPGNPERGVYRKNKKPQLGIATNDADQGAWNDPPGYWKYTVRVFDADGALLIEDDPDVAIDEDSETSA